MGLVETVLRVGAGVYTLGSLGAATAIGIKVNNMMDMPYDSGFSVFAGIMAGVFSSAILLSPIGIASLIMESRGGGKSSDSGKKNSYRSTPKMHTYDPDYGGWNY